MGERKVAYTILIVLVILLIYGIVRFSSGLQIDKDGYQGVVLTTGIAYYGHLKDVKSNYPVLTDVYYLQQGGPSGLNLVKFGTEPQAPKDVMFINKPQILYWYNLNPNGELYKKILLAKTSGVQ